MTIRRGLVLTLAENDDAPIALVAGPGFPDVDPADDEQLRVNSQPLPT